MSHEPTSVTEPPVTDDGMAPKPERKPVRREPLRVKAGRLRTLLPASPGLGFLLLVFVVPVFGVLLQGFTEPSLGLQNYVELLGNSTFYRILFNTFLVAVLVTIFSILVGFPVAWLITVAPTRISRIVLSVILLSMWTSLLARTYAWLVLLQQTGVVNKLLMEAGLIDQPLALVNNLTGVVIGMTYIMIPFVVLPLQTNMASIDNTVMQAASVCGASTRVVFTRIFLPLVLPGLTAGGTLVFVMSLGYYVTPALLGSTSGMMLAEYIVEKVLTYLQWGVGGAAGLILLAITLAIYIPVLGLQRNTANT